MKKITNMPIALMCGKEDLISSPADYNWLKGELEAA